MSERSRPDRNPRATRARHPGRALALGATLAAVMVGTAAWPGDKPVQVTIAPVSSTTAATTSRWGDYTASRVETLLAHTDTPAESNAVPPTARTAAEALARMADGQTELWIGRLDPAEQPLPAGVRVTELDWSSSPMAIMRSDTDIRTWRDLRGRTVCVSTDGRHVGRLAHDFGAIEQPYPVAANALVALRTGQCDAAVADESFMQQLLSYPEWQKFSARLTPATHEPLVALWPARLSLRQQWEARKITGKSALREARQTLARSIAFEVYLDQDAPDCHG